MVAVTILKEFSRRFREDGCLNLSAAIAFYAILSLIPFNLAIKGFIELNNHHNDLVDLLFICYFPFLRRDDCCIPEAAGMLEQ